MLHARARVRACATDIGVRVGARGCMRVRNREYAYKCAEHNAHACGYIGPCMYNKCKSQIASTWQFHNYYVIFFRRNFQRKLFLNCFTSCY